MYMYCFSYNKYWIKKQEAGLDYFLEPFRLRFSLSNWGSMLHAQNGKAWDSPVRDHSIRILWGWGDGKVLQSKAPSETSFSFTTWLQWNWCKLHFLLFWIVCTLYVGKGMAFETDRSENWPHYLLWQLDKDIWQLWAFVPTYIKLWY